MTILEILKSKPKQAEKKEKTSAALLRQLEAYERRNKKKLDDPSHVFKLLRYSFKMLLSLDYEFTYEELIQEIEKRKMKKPAQQKLLAYVQKISDMEFGVRVGNPETLLGELNAILKEL